MKNFFLALPLVLTFECQASSPTPTSTPPPNIMQSSHEIISPMQQTTAPVSQEGNGSTYIPKSVDMSKFLRLESACWFIFSRCVLQPINVVAPLLATGVVAASNMCKDSNKTLSNALGWTGCGLSALEFATSVLLVKINSKLQHTDEYVEERTMEEKKHIELTKESADSSKNSSDSTENDKDIISN